MDFKKLFMQFAFFTTLFSYLVKAKVIMPYRQRENHLQETVATCTDQANRHHCKFYSCLEDSFHAHCGPSLIDTSLGRRFCDVTKHHQEHFSTPTGVEWARSTNRCMMVRLAELSETEPHTEWCYRADTFIKAAFETCAQEADICSVLVPEKAALLHVFSNRSWMEVVQAARHCDRADVSEFITLVLTSQATTRRAPKSGAGQRRSSDSQSFPFRSRTATVDSTNQEASHLAPNQLNP